MKVFIGCSLTHLIGKNENDRTLKLTVDNVNRSNSLALKIYNKYKNDSEIEMKPWWDKKVIKPGADFFRRILELSKICDLGIFILSAETLTKKVNTFISNDNVYIELGAFIASKGLSNTIFLWEKGVKPPSDFSGLNLVEYDFTKDADAIISYINDRLKSKRQNLKNYIDFQLQINKRTTDKIFETKPITQSWKSKSAYIGLDAAKTWNSIERNPDYMSGVFKERFRKFIYNKLRPKLKVIHNIVSLGSGIGTIDTMIVEGINFDGIKYIPIEINPYLAYRALDNVINATLKSVNSFAIIDDFEDEIAQLSDFLNETLVRKEEVSLYIMLGGTFCNIENSDSFLKEYSELLDDNDFFLIDASTFNDEYDITRDTRNRLQSSNAIKLLTRAIEFKQQSNEQFKSNSRVQEFLLLDEQEQEKQIFKNKFVKIDAIDRRDKNRNVTFLYRFCFDEDCEPTSENSILFKIKRYNSKALEQKIRHHFDLEKLGRKNHHAIELSEDIGMSFYLLKRKKNTTK